MTDIVTATDLAGWLGVVAGHLPDLASKGHVVRASHGKYRLKESVQAYTRYQRGRAAGLKQSDAAREDGSAKDRLEEAKARLAEAEVAKAEGEWLPASAIVQANTELAVIVRTKLLTIEAKVPPEARAATRSAIHEALNEIADHDPSELAARIAAEVSGSASSAAEPDAQ